MSLGTAPGPATLDEADAQLVEVAGDRELVADGEREALLLRAVAQCRVVDMEELHGSTGDLRLVGCVIRFSTYEKDPPRSREV